MKVASRLATVLLCLVLGACGGKHAAGPGATGTAGATHSLDSFRYVLDATASGILGPSSGDAPPVTLNIHVLGDVAGPQRDRTETTMSLGGPNAIQLERLRVDDRIWARSGPNSVWSDSQGNAMAGSGGVWVEESPLLGPDANARLRATVSGQPPAAERLGETETLRYTVTAPQLRTILGLQPENEVTSFGRVVGDSTLWVTKAGMFPARIVTEATPSTGGTVHVQIDFKDWNAAGIAVEAPPAATRTQ